MVMGVIAWIVFGLIAGYMASTLTNRRDDGLRFDMLLGAVGAVVGGGLFTAVGAAGVTSFNVWSLLVAVIGAMVLLVVWQAIRRLAWHA